MIRFSFRSFCFGCFLFPSLLLAQRKQVVFQTASYQTCDSAQATYRVELNFTDAGEKACLLKRFWMDGKLMEEISYSHYEKREKDGPETEYFSNGRVKMKCNWLDYERHDSLKTFYPNGTRKRAEVYREGKWISGKCYGKSGADTVFSPLESDPVFPGSLAQFVAENTRYPRKAFRKSIEGQAIVSFAINRFGKVTDIIAVQPAEELLAEEAVRVVRQMPDWQPGTFDGEPVKVQMRLPFRFKLPQNKEPESKRWSE
jgi:TonB family protein